MLADSSVVKVFDMLFINGRSLLGEPLSKRKREMHMALKEVPGRVEFVAEFRGRTVEDVRTRLAQVMADRGEGLVLKHSRSTYIPNGRNHDWIKVKPEYMVGIQCMGSSHGCADTL
jgi:DNA ligase-4